MQPTRVSAPEHRYRDRPRALHPQPEASPTRPLSSKKGTARDLEVPPHCSASDSSQAAPVTECLLEGLSGSMIQSSPLVRVRNSNGFVTKVVSARGQTALLSRTCPAVVVSDIFGIADHFSFELSWRRAAASGSYLVDCITILGYMFFMHV